MLWHELLTQIEAAVQALNGLGFGRGDRIAVALPPGPECPTALVSVMAGFVCVPLNPDYSVTEFAASLLNTRVVAVVTQSALVPNAVLAARRARLPVVELEPRLSDAAGMFRLCGEHVDSHAPPRPSRGGFSTCDELAAIFSTSGTTSTPKLIPLTQAMICYRASRSRNFVDLTPSDRCLDLMPSFHGDAILVSILGSFFAGGSSVYGIAAGVDDFARQLHKWMPTWCALPPAFLEKLVSKQAPWNSRENPDGLRVFFTCGAPVSAETVEATERMFGIPLQNSYGATECGGVAANPMPPGVRKPRSVGISIGLELAVLDDSGQPLSPAQSGEIGVRGPGVFSGYEICGESTDSIVEGAWYRTGDCGYIDSDGYLFLTGRLGELINRGGEKVSPEEVEQVLRKHSAVRDAAVFPMSHPLLGQDVAALVVPHASAPDVHELRRFVAQHLAGFKVPRRILVVSEIPLGPTAKVQRNRLASLFAAELATPVKVGDEIRHAPGTQVERLLCEIWAGILQVEPVGIRDRFLDLGGDSLLGADMLSQVERKFGRSIPMGPFWQSPTVQNLATLLIAAEHRKSSPLLPVQTSGDKPPLFFVLPGWFVSEAELLSRYLGPDQPVYALIPDARPGAGQNGMSPAEIVAECVELIERTQNSGPYFVIGRSVAGLIALDIAQSLTAKGRSVGLVGLLDSHYPGIARPGLLPSPLRQIEFFVGELVAIPRAQWPEYLRRLPLRAMSRIWRGLRGQRAPAQDAIAALHTGLQRLFHAEPASWPGRITMFAAESSRYRGFLDRRLYWSRAAEQGLEVYLVPGDHNMMVQEPHIQKFAVTLKGCLARARRSIESVEE